MYNTNPTLIMGQTLRWLDNSGADIRPHERDRVEVRVYEPSGTGYYFTAANQAVRWYYRESPDADYFIRGESSAVEAAINAGGKIQVCGSRGISYGVWDTFHKFEEEINGNTD